MSTSGTPSFQRAQAAVLKSRLAEPRRFLQIVAGPRQVGKTTMVHQVLQDLGSPHLYGSADEPTPGDTTWIATRWERARALAREHGLAVLALDEVQKVPQWSETVKRLWDEDSAAGTPLHVVLLGSAPLLVRRGLTESLSGRFEILHLSHWSFLEMRRAFGFGIEDHIIYGGYPGAAALIDDGARWREYVLGALVESTIARDVLLMSRVDKPALLRRLFELGCHYSGQILSLTKLMGQLQDAGNTTTLSHYLDLLCKAGMLTGLQKYAGQAARRRASSPKFQVFNTALLTALMGSPPPSLAELEPAVRGRLVESAVGAHLLNDAAVARRELFYWRDRNREVDFVVPVGTELLAIEVKSGRSRDVRPGLGAFCEAFPRAHPLLVGGEGIPVEEFLSHSADYWLGH